MRKSRFTEAQIIGMIKEQEAGLPTSEICRKHGLSPASFYKFKAKYGGMEVSEAARLKALEDENAKLKRLLADALHDRLVWNGGEKAGATGRDARSYPRASGFLAACRDTCPYTESLREISLAVSLTAIAEGARWTTHWLPPAHSPESCLVLFLPNRRKYHQ